MSRMPGTVRATSATARAAAQAYGVPALEPTLTALRGLADLLAGEPSRRRVVTDQVRQDQAALDAWFEEVAEQVRKAVAPAEERAVLTSTERYAAMELAHAAMRAKTSTEVLHAAESVQVQVLEVIPDDLRSEVDRLEAELLAVMSTRTMRMLNPARTAYSRLRARVR